jgi:hypothetical protein
LEFVKRRPLPAFVLHLIDCGERSAAEYRSLALRIFKHLSDSLLAPHIGGIELVELLRRELAGEGIELPAAGSTASTASAQPQVILTRRDGARLSITCVSTLRLIPGIRRPVF